MPVAEPDASQSIAHGYDKRGSRTSMTYPSGRSVAYTHTALGQLDRVSANGQLLADYDYAGTKIRRETFGNGVTLDRAYDEVGRVTGHIHSRGSSTVAGFNHGYDAVGRKLYSEVVHDPSRSELYRYDSTGQLSLWKQGQLTADKTDVPEPVHFSEWQFDAMGNWTTLTTENGTETRLYNDANELIDTNGPVAANAFTTALYHFGETSGMVVDESAYANNGIASSGVNRGATGIFGLCYEFTGRDAVIVNDSPSLSLTNDFTIEFWVNPDHYNKSMLVGKWSEKGPKSYAIMLHGRQIRALVSHDGRTETVAIVSQAQLVKGQWTHVALTRSGAEVALWIDGERDPAVGSFAGAIHDSSVPLRIGASDHKNMEFRGRIDEVRILSIAKTTFGHQLLQEFDANGNLVNDGMFRYFWDAFNRLAYVTLSSDTSVVIAAYSYDTNHRRTIRTVANSGELDGTTRYTYSGDSDWQVIEERDGNDNLLREYTWGSFLYEPVAMTSGSTTYYYHANTLYSVAALTDASGQVVERYRYTPYGEPTILAPDGSERATSAVGNPYMYSGIRYDGETGLYYYGFRYYNPILGRWPNRDPIGELGGVHLYAFVSNSPLDKYDVLGCRTSPGTDCTYIGYFWNSILSEELLSSTMLSWSNAVEIDSILCCGGPASWRLEVYEDVWKKSGWIEDMWSCPGRIVFNNYRFVRNFIEPNTWTRTVFVGCGIRA